MTEIPQNDLKRIVQKLDLNALADAFEAQGKITEANQYRALAKREPEAEQRTAERLKAFQDKRTAEQWQKTNEELAKRPKLPHNPKYDVIRLDTNTIKVIEQMLKPTNQNKPPSSIPNASKAPTPSGGK